MSILSLLYLPKFFLFLFIPVNLSIIKLCQFHALSRTHTQNHNTFISVIHIKSSSSLSCRSSTSIRTKAFHKITNFIRKNGNNWEEFCNSTTLPWTTRNAVKTLHCVERYGATKLPTRKTISPLSHSFKRIPIVLSCSPSNTTTSG